MNNKSTKYEIRCFRCGAEFPLVIVPHRDKQNHMVGQLFVCAACAEFMADKYLEIKFEGKATMP